MGLFVCGNSFQLQRLFLRLRKIRAVVPSQYHCHYVCESARRLPDLQAFPDDTVSHATATGSLLSVVICVIAFAVITKNRDENQHSGWGGKRKF